MAYPSIVATAPRSASNLRAIAKAIARQTIPSVDRLLRQRDDLLMQRDELLTQRADLVREVEKLDKQRHDFLSGVDYAMSDLTKAIANDWQHHSYYSEAERWLHGFWKDGTMFRFYFDQLDTDRTLELACGHGRHAAQIVEKVAHLTLVDVNEENIARCRSRFSGHCNITYVTNNGADLRDVTSGSQTAAFCYDSMVHFEADVVIGYLGELARILAYGGRAVLHYSNMHWMPGSKYGDGPHMRNFFSEEMMIHFSQRAGLRLIGHSTLDWGTNPIWHNLDGLVLLENSRDETSRTAKSS